MLFSSFNYKKVFIIILAISFLVSCGRVEYEKPVNPSEPVTKKVSVEKELANTINFLTKKISDISIVMSQDFNITANDIADVNLNEEAEKLKDSVVTLSKMLPIRAFEMTENYPYHYSRVIKSLQEKKICKSGYMMVVASSKDKLEPVEISESLENCKKILFKNEGKLNHLKKLDESLTEKYSLYTGFLWKVGHITEKFAFVFKVIGLGLNINTNQRVADFIYAQNVTEIIDSTDQFILINENSIYDIQGKIEIEKNEFDSLPIHRDDWFNDFFNRREEYFKNWLSIRN